MTKKCVEWLNNNRNTTPRLVYDLEKVKENFYQFVKLFGVIKPYYAVKANPSVKIVALLKKLGSNFDCASINEIKICTDLGINARKILEGKFPDRLVRMAVKRMIPKGPLGRKQLSNMKVYIGDKHPHEAQNPKMYNIQEVV